MILELHDQLDQVEGVGVEVLLERGLLRELTIIDSELLDEYWLDPLENFFAGHCHCS